MSTDVAVIEEPAAAASLLDPLRARVLSALAEPGSATKVAASLRLPRQQINYHLRALETHGLVDLVEERQRRGLVERIFKASARGYVVSPAVLGDLAADPRESDQLSARYVIALAARVVRDVAGLLRAAATSGKKLPTLAIDTELRFATASARASFTADLAEAVRTLATRYHDEGSAGGRWHRLVVASYPRPTDERRTK
jgi:DNA-binding transcriptional ArsR family regulator